MPEEKAVVKRRKMNTGNMESCLRKARHHLSPGSTWAMMRSVIDPKDVLEYRHKITREEIEEALTRIGRIRSIALVQDNRAILGILDEQFEFGHDIEEE